MSAKAGKPKKIEILNKRAKFEYYFVNTFDAGILLQGTEIKSIRNGQANLSDAYCRFKDGELYVHSMYISEYKFGNNNNHEPRRTRKLLLKRIELRKLERKVKEKGFTIVPYRLYISERRLAKLEIALVSGKKSHDKRHVIKERENKRAMDRIKKIRL